VVGDEAAVIAQVREYEAAGVTDFVAAPFEAPGSEVQRTLELLSALVRDHAALA
jgi:alkanesulfonate monooxygenase SsuD/methylene tetrahydromethanopterin reductase-like flavin-dependent oxidoreductase (luciferase family)